MYRVEPRFPGCRPGVFPLDQQPKSIEHQPVNPGIEPDKSAYESRSDTCHAWEEKWVMKEI